MVWSGRASLRLYAVLVLILTASFAASSVASYLSSRESIRDGIIQQELPLTADTVYSEIQKDLIRPVFVSSMMATDTFLRNWVLRGEQNVGEMIQYLEDVKSRFGAVTTFFVSAKTNRYYYADGVLKTVRQDEPRDAWFWRVRDMREPYETNVDPDLSRQDALTIFINYRVVDFEGHFLGAAGIGLAVESVRDFVRQYEARYDRQVSFADAQGTIVLSAGQPPSGSSLVQGPFPWATVRENTSGAAAAVEYEKDGRHWLASVRYLAELHWYLIVEKDEGAALEGIQSTLWINLSLCLAATAVVVALFGFTVGGYQKRLEQMAWTDRLTGLANRPSGEAALNEALKESHRTGEPLVLAIVDADHFKNVNDHFGHEAGDKTLQDLARLLKTGTREGDAVARWGGEEFLILLRNCDVDDGVRRFSALLTRVDEGPWTRPETAVTISIGVAGHQPGEALNGWLSRADAALYRAKESGRHRVEVSS